MKKYYPYIFSLTFFSCITNRDNSVDIKKIDSSTVQPINKEIEEKYLEAIPKKFHKKENEILIFFTKGEFSVEKLIINRKDTIKLKGDCGLMPFIQSKKQKKILLQTPDGNKKKIKLLSNFDYIVVEAENKKWYVTYYPYFPVIRCL
ncbi:MAG TPA: hypothetical protein VIG94_00640 [Faecalibacter sp.]